MQVGSWVETVADFSEVRNQWGFNYPQKGDILTISMIEDHPNLKVREKGIVLLHFDELPELPGVCDKQFVDGTPNFIELLPPIPEEYEDTKPISKQIKSPKLQEV